jgi:lipopolysaccharide export system permease protein
MKRGLEVFVFGSILHRMILWELVKVFVMALIGITGILLMAGIVAEAAQEGLGPAQILAAIPLLIPSTLPYTIPATTLFACCVTYGRIAADNEILAIKSSGVNILLVVRPGLLLGLAMTCLTMGLYWDVIPSSHRLLRRMVFDDAEEVLYSMLRKQRSINFTQMPFAMWVEGVEGRKLIDPVIKRRNAQGQTEMTARAKEAELHVDMARRKITIELKAGTATLSDNDNLSFQDLEQLEVDLPPSFGADADRRARDMTWNEILEKRKVLEKAEAAYKATIAEGATGATEPLPPTDPALDGSPDAPKDLRNLRREEQYCEQQILWLNVELLMRPALSAGCFCFILVGCPVGIWFNRSDYLSSFIVCFLPIVLLYYPLLLCGTGMAKDGRMDPVLLLWGANLIMALIGGVLFWRLLKN